MRRPRRLAVLATVLGLSLSPVRGWSADPGPGSSPAALFGLGKQSLGLAGGFGFALPIADTGDEQLQEVEFVYVAPRWGIGISDPMGRDAWYRGSFEVVAEGALLYQVEPENGFAGGITAMLRYNFLRGGPFIPFAEAGVGILVLDWDLEERSDGVNFSPQAGFGFHYFVSPRTALTSEWRWHHISNAGIDQPNRAINSSLFLIGVTTFLK
jgi:lipid A 3-O-deacylase